MKKIFIFLCIIILLSTAALAISIPSLNKALENDDFRAHLLSKLASTMNGTMDATAVSIVLTQKTIDISCKNLTGELLKNTLTFDIPDGRIKIPYAGLLKGSITASSLQLVSPWICYRSAMTSPLTDPPNKKNQSMLISNLLGRLSGYTDQMNISDGTVILGTTTFAKICITTGMKAASLTTVNLQTNISYNNSTIPLKLSGTLRHPLLGSLRCSFDITAESLPLQLVPASQDFFFSGGTADFSGKLNSNGEDIQLDGTVTINDLNMTVGRTSDDKTIHKEKKYRIARSSLQLHGNLRGRTITFSTLDLRSDTFNLQGTCTLDLSNRGKPTMDLHIKTDVMAISTLKMLLPDPLINDWISQTIFPRLENGTARLTDLSISGTLDEIARLDEPEHAHCLSWSGIVHNVDTFYNDHKFLGKVNNAQLSMNDDLLTITEIKGESGVSRLDLGDVSISNIYDPTPLLTANVEGVFSLPWLATLIRAELIGDEMQQLLRPISRLSGNVDGFLKLSVGLDKNLQLKILSSKGTADRLNLQADKLAFPIIMKKADFTLSYPGNSVISGKGTWGKTHFNGSLKLSDFYKKQEARLRILADIPQLKKTLSENKATLDSLAPCISRLPLQAVFTAQNGTLSSKGSFDFKHFTTLPTPLCKQRAAENKLLRVDYALKSAKNTVTIKNLVLQATQGKLEIKGLLQTKPGVAPVVKKMSLRTKNFPVHSIVLLIPEQNNILNGTLDAELTSSGFSAENIWRSLNGKVQLNNWQGSLGEEIKVNTMDLTLSMDDKSIFLLGQDIRLADFNPETPLDLQVTLQKKDALEGTVLLYGKYLDVTTIPGLITKKKTKIHFPVPIHHIDIFTGFDQVHFRNLNFSPLLMESSLLHDRFIISRYLLEQDNSFVWLTGQWQHDAVLYQSFFKIIDKPINSWMKLLGFKNNLITGSMNLQGKLTARVKPGEVISENASGPLYLEIQKGTLKSSSTSIKLLDLISLENIFSKKDVLQWKNLFHFNLIQGRFDLHNGIFSTNSLMMDAPAFDLLSEGTINILQHTINMQLKIAPFGTISNFFGAIPYLGYVLTGKSGGLVDYTYKVQGKIKNADVKYVPLKGTFKSLFGYAKRLISQREKIKKEVNDSIQSDMIPQRDLKEDMRKKLAPLRLREETCPPYT